jgi:putative ABC transport system ATP-binding protein
MTDQALLPILQLRDVGKAYKTGDGPFIALDGINMDVFQGEFLGITGKSGAGKTTLLNMISGVSELTTGEILFRGYSNGKFSDQEEAISVHSMDEDTLAVWRGQNLVIVYQSFELLPTLNLLENVMLPQDFSGAYHPVLSKERALELLEIVDIAEHAYKIPAHISGGQKQRVAIARALVNDPPVIIADEPTGNLDTVTADRIFQIFEELVGHGKTVIVVTHDDNLATRFSRRLRIADGVLTTPLTESTPDKNKQSYSDRIKITSGTHPFQEYTGKTSLAASRKNGGSLSHPSFVKSAAISLQNVVKTYENAAGRFTALKGIDLEFDSGQFISIVGKSGCGKSTLLNMITGIDHPTLGSVTVGGEDIYAMSESKRALWRGKNIGVVFQFFQLLPTLTLLENTMLPMDYCNVHAFRDRPEKAMKLLQMVGLEEHAHKLPGNVSSGQQQGAAIARALATDPPLILADEPTGNLDSRSADIILNLFEQLAADGKTILIVTHDPSITHRTDQTVILSDGEVIDPTVVRALPFLDHAQMLAATQKSRKLVYPPGSTIIHQGESVKDFFMIINGEVEVVANTKIPETRLVSLGPGQFFGEVSLMMGGNSIASVRALPEKPTELALISKEEFLDLLKASPNMKNAMDRVAQIRLDENRMLIESYRAS